MSNRVCICSYFVKVNLCHKYQRQCLDNFISQPFEWSTILFVPWSISTLIASDESTSKRFCRNLLLQKFGNGMNHGQKLRSPSFGGSFSFSESTDRLFSRPQSMFVYKQPTHEYILAIKSQLVVGEVSLLPSYVLPCAMTSLAPGMPNIIILWPGFY